MPARTTLLRSKTILEYVTDSNRHTRKGMTMRITMNHIVPLVAAGAAAVAIAAAPTAAATTGTTGSNVQHTPGNVQITAGPGGAAQEAAQLQQPFGGDTGALLFHKH